MGKIDDMRRLREQQFATAEARRSATPRATAPAAAPAAAAPVESEPVMQTKTKTKTKSKSPIGGKRAGAADVEGKCSVCGKVRAVSNGVVSEHQKGFGKACPGSRKKPA